MPARRWLVILVWLVLAIGGGAAYLAWATPLYRASTSILIDPSGAAALGASEAQSGRLNHDASLVESRVRLVSSPSVLARVVESQHLLDDPEFNNLQEPLLSRLRKLVGEGPQVPDVPLEQRVLAALAERLHVEGSANTLIIDIEVASHDPAKAARLADAVAAAFVQEQLATQPRPKDQESYRPDPGLGQLEETVRADKRQLEAFKADHPALTGSAGTSGEQQLHDLNGALLRTRTALTEARARLEQVERVAQNGRLETLPDSLQAGVIGTLRSQAADAQRQIDGLARILGPRHPDFVDAQRQLQAVQALVRDELRRITARVRNEVDVARTAEAAALRALDAKQREVAQANEARTVLRRLERTLESDRAAYDRLLAAQSARSAQPEETAPTPIARQLAPALLPLKADGPTAEAVLLIAAALGLTLGLLTGFRRKPRPHVWATPPPVGTLLLEGPPVHAAAAAQSPGEPAQGAGPTAQGDVRHADRESAQAKPGAPLPDDGSAAAQLSRPARRPSSAGSAAPASTGTEQAYVRRFHLPAVADRSGIGGAAQDEPAERASAEGPGPMAESASDEHAPEAPNRSASPTASAADGYVRRFHLGRR
jgi:uncharacterized protein involved in exopolysaccharide biosynthesis